ncbi:CYTH domain-containing protein [Candidatus Bathyarchaeota archaeon]|nr:MAG: CYTH domain-containing protein [Candidatus Bathyarchaeota archaeon]
MASQKLSDRETFPPSAFEAEIALIIKDDAGRIRKELAGIRRILEYELRLRPPRTIYDTYYDTRKNSLRRKKISLRTRRMGKTLIISTKSDIQIISGNIIRRRETELPWSYDSVCLLARTLRLKTPAISASRFQSIPPPRTLTTMGLNVIQERRTRREARDIVRRNKNPNSTLAELAIDRVTYTFEDITVGLSEVEVEAKSPRSLANVQKIANMLISKYQPNLQQWFHGKFVTGLAIGKLLKIRALQSYLEKGRLGPKAFEAIDRTIRSRRF